MAEQLGLFDVADCIKGGMSTSNAQLMRDVGTSRSGATGRTGFDLVGSIVENLPKGLKHKMVDYRAGLKRAKAMNPDKPSLAEEVLFTNMLSNPVTFMRNLVGNAVQGVMQSGVRGMQGATKGDMGQALAQFQSFGEGVRHAWEQAGKAWAVGRPTFLKEEGEYVESELRALGDVTGAKGIYKTIPRLMGATDDFFTTLGWHMSVQDQVYRKAFEKVGDRGHKAVTDEALKLLGHLPDDIKATATLDARRAVFKDFTEDRAHQTIMKAFQTAKGFEPLGVPVGRYVLPFVRTPINLTKRSLEYTPMNMMYGFDQVLRKGNVNGQMNIYRGMMGTSLMTWFGHLAYNGKISGDGGNLSPGEMSAKRAGGWQPSSVKFGEKWYSYRNFGPITTLMTIGGNVGERARDTGLLSMQTYMDLDGANLITDTVKGIVDASFLPTLVEYGTAIAYPERYGDKGVQSLLRTLRSQVVPSAAVSLWKAIDPTIREPAGFVDTVKSPLTLISGGQAKLGLFGEELRRTGAASDNFVDIFLNPARASEVASDPLIQEVARLQDVGIEGSGFMPPKISDKSLGFKKDILTEDEIFLGSRAKGFVQRSLMENILKSPGYQGLDDTLKLRLLRKMYDKAGRITNARIRGLKLTGKPLTYRDIVQGFE